MKLNDSQIQIVIEKLQNHVSRTCPMCGKQDLEISDTIFELRQLNNTGHITIGGKTAVFPVVPLTCKACGYIHFFNAIFLGVLNKEGK